MENFHTHLPYCKHASGSAEDYIREAERLGFNALGFSDHSPAPAYMPDVQNYKMSEAQMPLYRDEVREATRQSNIPIYLGMEVDIIQEEFSYLHEVIMPTMQPDFLIGSVHFIRLHDGRHAGLHEIESSHFFDRYIEQLLWGIEQTDFLFIGHPDRVMITEYVQKHDDELRSVWRTVAQSAKKYSKPLEYNTSLNAGMAPCLSPVLWEEILKEGVPIVVTSDAHAPERLGFGLKEGYQWLHDRQADIVYCSQLLLNKE